MATKAELELEIKKLKEELAYVILNSKSFNATTGVFFLDDDNDLMLVSSNDELTVILESCDLDSFSQWLLTQLNKRG